MMILWFRRSHNMRRKSFNFLKRGEGSCFFDDDKMVKVGRERVSFNCI